MSDPDPTTQRKTRRLWAVGAAALAVALLGAAFAVGNHHRHSTDPAMAARAQQVMPFDLTRISHSFTQTATGGVQTVLVKDKADVQNQALIRSHLQAEAAAFRRGDYSDPAKIHGMTMPGVSELERGASRVKVTYGDASGGAQITYTSTEPALVSAIHSWFDRQTSDHAMPGMGG